MTRGRGQSKGWESKARIFFTLMGKNIQRKEKREWHQDHIRDEFKKKGLSTTSTSIYRHLQSLKEIGIVESKKVKPERGIKKKNLYRINLSFLKEEERNALEKFFDKFGDDFKKRAIEGMNFELMKINDSITLLFLFKIILAPPIDAALHQKGKTEANFERFLSNGFASMVPFLNIGGYFDQFLGVDKYQERVKKYQKELSEEDVNFLTSKKDVINPALSEWLERAISTSRLNKIEDELSQKFSSKKEKGGE